MKPLHGHHTATMRLSMVEDFPVQERRDSSYGIVLLDYRNVVVVRVGLCGIVLLDHTELNRGW
jgi:hypothetical protein